jgi:hypothetical protein
MRLVCSSSTARSRAYSSEASASSCASPCSGLNSCHASARLPDISKRISRLAATAASCLRGSAGGGAVGVSRAAWGSLPRARI